VSERDGSFLLMEVGGSGVARQQTRASAWEAAKLLDEKARFERDVKGQSRSLAERELRVENMSWSGCRKTCLNREIVDTLRLCIVVLVASRV
jgi:hypothetical protein